MIILASRPRYVQESLVLSGRPVLSIEMIMLEVVADNLCWLTLPGEWQNIRDTDFVATNQRQN